MIFILDQDYALRSWRWVPYAVYKKYTPNAAPIAKEAFSLLLQCDGQQDIPDSELLSQLLQRGLIHPAAPGEKLSSWQNYMDCDNRYMPQVYLSLTGKCNFNCRHCFNAADNAPLMSEWDYETYLHFLDECRDCGVHAFFITGGEPMLHPRFMDMMRAIHERGMYVFRLNTNGAFLTEAVLDEMKSFGCIPEMWLSFDGIGWHDWMRGRKGAEEQALSSIRLCIEKGIPTGVHVNAHRGNKEVIPDTIRMLDDMGVKFTRVLRTTEAPRWEQNAQGMTLSFEEYYDLCLSLIHEYARSDSSMDLRLWQFIFLDAADHSYRIAPVHCAEGAYNEDIPLCGRNRLMLSVGAEGDVFPCHPMSGYLHGNGIDMGNVIRDGLQAILQKGPLLSYTCSGVGKVAKANEKCGNCQYFRYCTGGCRAIALGLTNDLMGPDPSKCFFYENGYYQRTVQALEGWKNLTPVGLLEQA